MLTIDTSIILDSVAASAYRRIVKFFQKALMAIAAIAGLVIFLSIIHHYQLKRELNRYMTQLKAKGEKLELSEIVPPHLSPEQNSAPLFLKASELLTTNENVLTTNLPTAMRGVAPGKAIVGWKQPNVTDGYATNSWEDIRAALALNTNGLKLLNQMTNGSRFDFQLAYSERFEMRITNLVSEKKAVQKLAASTAYDLHINDPTSAAKNIQTMLVLVNGMDDERTAISELVRMAMAQITAGSTWEFLQSTNLNDGMLAELQKNWSQLEFIKALERALPLEREGEITTIKKWRRSNSEFKHFFDLLKKVSVIMGTDDDENSFWGDTKLQANMFLWRYWWSYPDELRYLKGYEVLAKTVHSAEIDGFFKTALDNQAKEFNQLGISKLDNSLNTLLLGKINFHSMISESVQTLSGSIQKVMRVEAAKQMTITAIALKRYQLKHDNYPSDLNSLVPEFVSAVPADPVDGKPLRYRLNPDGTFLLYSIGENGKDDGGNASFEKQVESETYYWLNIHALDWVWPQPATAEEIQKYYKKSSTGS